MPVTGLHSVTLTVPDVAAGRDYYRDFGLLATESSDTVALRCDGRDQDQIVLTEGPRKKLAGVAFWIEPGSGGDILEKARAAGFRETGTDAAGIRLDGPDGVPVRLVEGYPARPRPYVRSAENIGEPYERIAKAGWETLPDAVLPRRMGHAILFASDMEQAKRFYLGVLGLHPSDEVKNSIAFWNAGPGDHHVFGVANSSHPGLHHASFEVGSVDEMAVGAEHLAALGHAEAWGIGRHMLGSNLFYYVKDPWGSWTEYFCDMDQVTEEWKPHSWDVAPSIWGGSPPPTFRMNLEE